MRSKKVSRPGSTDQLDQVLERLETLEQSIATSAMRTRQTHDPVAKQPGNSSPQQVESSPNNAEGWLTMGEAHEIALQRGYQKSKSGFQMMATPRNPEKTPPEQLYAEWGFEIDLNRRGGSGQRSRWIRSLPGWGGELPGRSWEKSTSG